LTAEDWARLAAAAAVFFLPGIAWLAWVPARGRSLPEKAAIAFGLSIAFFSLAALAGWWLRRPFTGVSLGILFLLSLFAIAAAAFSRRPFRLRITGPELAVFAVCTALLALRLFQARELAFPAWVDSVHHALIVRVFLEQGGLPFNLLPWMPVDFYYHFGFHASAAVIAALSQASPAAVLLVFGQFLSVMSALSIYRLSMVLRRDVRVALVAMALTAFVSEMPAFYLSWGRYTLLTGLVVLSLAMAEAVEYVSRAPRPANLIRLILFTAATLLTHYLAGLLLAAFLIVLALFHLRSAVPRRNTVMLTLAACAGAALSAVWLVRMLSYAAPEIGAVFSSPFGLADNSARLADWDYFLRLMNPARNAIFLAAGLLAAVFFLFRKSPFRWIAIWGLWIGCLALPWGFRLAPFRPDHFTIVVFLPASILVSAAAWMLVDAAARRFPRAHAAAIAWAVVGLACVAGAWSMRDIVNPVTVLADASDRAALAWVEENTPPDARFLINVTYWQAGLYRGVDGGWWLLPATGRQTTLPPAVYGMGDAQYSQGITQDAKTASELTGCTPAFWNLVEKERVSFLYIHAGRGSLQADALRECAGVFEVYHSAVVSIYQLILPSQRG
jgi:hypothetical protein